MTTVKRERPADGWPHETSPNRPFFVHDPLGDGFTYYATEEERDAASVDVIQDYLVDGWDEEVANVTAGILTHVTEQCDIVQQPPGSEFDYHCNYQLTAIKT